MVENSWWLQLLKRQNLSFRSEIRDQRCEVIAKRKYFRVGPRVFCQAFIDLLPNATPDLRAFAEQSQDRRFGVEVSQRLR